MFGINGNKDNEGSSIFDVKSIDELIEKLKIRFSKTLEEEIKDQLKRFKIEYLRGDHNTVNNGITAKAEEKAKEWICPRIPKWVNSDMLTLLGFLSSFIIAAGFVLGFFNRYYLFLIVIGFILNWFGDSFDGSLARYRKNTRPNYGYYIDHVIDGISVTILGLGIGLSGFIRIEIAMLFSLLYLLLIIHVELNNYVQGEFKYSFGLFGPTEFRIICILLSGVLFFVPVKYFEIYNFTLTQYDFFGIFVVIIMGLVLVYSIIQKGIELDKIDRKAWKKGS